MLERDQLSRVQEGEPRPADAARPRRIRGVQALEARPGVGRESRQWEGARPMETEGSREAGQRGLQWPIWGKQGRKDPKAGEGWEGRFL